MNKITDLTKAILKVVAVGDFDQYQVYEDGEPWKAYFYEESHTEHIFLDKNTTAEMLEYLQTSVDYKYNEKTDTFYITETDFDYYENKKLTTRTIAKGRDYETKDGIKHLYELTYTSWLFVDCDTVEEWEKIFD